MSRYSVKTITRSSFQPPLPGGTSRRSQLEERVGVGVGPVAASLGPAARARRGVCCSSALSGAWPAGRGRRASSATVSPTSSSVDSSLLRSHAASSCALRRRAGLRAWRCLASVSRCCAERVRERRRATRTAASSAAASRSRRPTASTRSLCRPRRSSAYAVEQRVRLALVGRVVDRHRHDPALREAGRPVGLRRQLLAELALEAADQHPGELLRVRVRRRARTAAGRAAPAAP